MLRVTQNRGGRALLDDTPGVHHHNVLGHLRDNPEIVGNQHHRHPVGPRLVAQQAQDLRLHGDVQGGCRLIGNQQLRLAAQRHGNHHPLQHAAGKLMRIAGHQALRARQPDIRQALGSVLPCGLRRLAAVANQRFAELLADGEYRIQGGHRLLKNHRQLIAAQVGHTGVFQPQQVLALKKNFPAVNARRLRWQQAH